MGPTPLPAPVPHLPVATPTTSSFSALLALSFQAWDWFNNLAVIFSPTHFTDRETEVQSRGSEVSEVSKVN